MVLKIKVSEWTLISEYFSEEEKKLLRGALIAHCICPPVFTVDIEKLPKELTKKIEEKLHDDNSNAVK